MSTLLGTNHLSPAAEPDQVAETPDAGEAAALRTSRFGTPLPERVAVFRALQLGDLLCAVPAFRALRAALPRAHVVLVGLPWARAFARRFGHYFDGFLEFPGHPALPEQPARLERFPAFLAAAQAERFDLAIQMHGSGVLTNALTVLLGARATAGYYLPGHYCPDPDRFVPYPAGEPEVWRHLRLMEFLGAPPQGEELEFPVTPADEQALAAVPEARDLEPGAYACVHPGARGPARRWPPERFAAVADALAARGLRVVLTGTAEERLLTRAVAAAMRATPLDLAGRTSLGAAAVLLRDARLLVCNDTGVSHLAAALRVPSVVVFHGLAETQGWPPRDRLRHRVVCSIAGVTPDMVIAQVDDMLHSPKPPGGSPRACQPSALASAT